MASTVPLTQGNEALAALVPYRCSYCQSPIAPGERWVREKVFDSLTAGDAHYRRYHADLYGDDVLSCWEKHQVEKEDAAERVA